MVLPLYDDNPRRHIAFPYLTVAFIAACVLVFLWQVSLSPQEQEAAVYALGAIPAVVLGGKTLPPELAWVPAEMTLFTSMFMHGGWMHLIGNMLYLWILGDNVEDSVGHGRFVIFYLLCGLAAAFAHILQDTASTVPMVGASGAISGVIGAYILLHPHATIHTLVFRFVIGLPAWVALGLWIALQVFNAAQDPGSGGGVAWWAHIGGAVAGMLLIPFFKKRDVALFDRPGPARRKGPWRR